jgi:hypothetical protein
MAAGSDISGPREVRESGSHKATKGLGHNDFYTRVVRGDPATTLT